jgi:glycosyltransferase involved in cell wall biosynthesis
MNEDKVLVSVVIPMRNEEKFIGRCLDSILESDFPSEQFEIIVVDGDSTDRSGEIVRERQQRFPRLSLLVNPQKIVPTAMNLGIQHARGRYIVRLDAHAEYPPQYIRASVEELERTGAANVGGRWLTRPGRDSSVARAIAYVTQNPIAIGNARYRTGGGGKYVDTVPFGTFRREIFDEVGFFREDLVRHQDFELNARIRAAGGKIFLSPLVQCVYYNVPTFSKFMRQAYVNGLWCARAWTRYPVSFCWRHAAPLMLVSGLLAGLIAGAFLNSVFWLTLSVLLLYLLSAVVAGVQTGVRHGWKYAGLAPLLMISYHFVYGAATIYGYGVVVADWLTAKRTSLKRNTMLQARG